MRYARYACFFLLPALLAASCNGGHKDDKPVADRGPGGLHPVPDPQAPWVAARDYTPTTPQLHVDYTSTTEGATPAGPTPEVPGWLMVVSGIAVFSGIYLVLSLRRKAPEVGP